MCTIDYSREILKKLATPEFLVKEISDHPSLMFRLNTLFYVNRSDTNEELGMRGRLFLATQPKNDSDVFNVNNYSKFNLIDSIHYGNLILKPEMEYKIEEDGKYVYLPFYLADSKQSRIPIDKIFIVRYQVNSLLESTRKIYEVDNFYVKTAGDFFLRVSNRGSLFVINNKYRMITDLDLATTISFAEITGDSSNSVKILDLRIINDTLTYAVNMNGASFTGRYCVRNHKYELSRLSEFYASIIFANNDVIGYKSDKNGNIFLEKIDK